MIICLNGIEPSHAASEAAALSTELQAHFSTFIIPYPLEKCKYI